MWSTKFLQAKEGESKTARFNQHLSDCFNFYYGDLMVKLVTFGFLIYQGILYVQLTDRPKEIFGPMNYFDSLLMPSFPATWVFYPVLAVIALGLYLSFKRPKVYWLRIGVFVGLMWVNAFKWSYGFFSHVGHILLIYHFLSMFLNSQIPSDEKDMATKSRSIALVYFGIFVTYSMSGIWKLLGLAYKIVFTPGVINWLHPDAARVNASVGFRDWDMDMSAISWVYDIPVFWQFMVLVMLFLQVFSFVGAVVRPLRLWFGIGNILFHVHNIIFIMIHFYLSPLMLLVVFFPYAFFMKGKLGAQHIAVEDVFFDKASNTYRRVYANGDKDEFSGFEARRQRLLDEKPFWAGWLFFPGVALVASWLGRTSTSKA